MPALSKETMKMLSQSYKGDDLAGYLHDSLEAAGKIRAKLRSCREDEHTENTRHNLALKDIGLALKEVRNECLHWQTTYTPDASGNNDSSIDCDICGFELNRAERQKWIPKP